MGSDGYGKESTAQAKAHGRREPMLSVIWSWLVQQPEQNKKKMKHKAVNGVAKRSAGHTGLSGHDRDFGLQSQDDGTI